MQEYIKMYSIKSLSLLTWKIFFYYSKVKELQRIKKVRMMKMLKIYRFFLSLFFSMSMLASTIDIPRKISKRLMMINENIDAKQRSSMPAFDTLLNALENGEQSLSNDLVRAGLRELEHFCQALPADNDPAKTDILTQYCQKVKNDLEEIVPVEDTRATITTTIVPCIANVITSPIETQICNLNGSCQGTPCTRAETEQQNGNFIVPVTITDTSASTDCSSGALTVLGGAGIQGALNVCGPEHIFNSTPSTDCDSGALVVDGGVGIAQDLNVCGMLTVGSKKQSLDCTSGALVVAGGQGIGGNLNVCGNTHISSTYTSATCKDGALVVDGGIGIGKNATICGAVKILDTTKSAGCLSGSLVAAGGVGVGGDINICGKERIYNLTDSSANNNGALVVDGGVGIGGNLNVYGAITAQGAINSSIGLFINGSTVIESSYANCNFSAGDDTNPVANGTANTAVGEHAMQNNQIGFNDTAVGCQALELNIAGHDNAVFGYTSNG